MTEVIGDYPEIERVSTGMFGLDRALGDPHRSEWGMPLRCVYEEYGRWESGKSTLAYYLAGRVREKGLVDVIPFERADKKYIQSAFDQAGFKGQVLLEPMMEEKSEKGKRRFLPHGKVMKNAVTRLLDENVNALVLDSMGSIISEAIVEGDVGEAFMGQRAKMIADFARRLEPVLMNRISPALAIGINHVGPVIGGRGHDTSGGVVFKFVAAVRIMLYWKEGFEDQGFLAEGSVEKNRFGGKGRQFLTYFMPGIGVHPDLTAMFDCLSLKVAERNKQGMIKVGGSTVARIGALLDAGEKGNSAKFKPFYEALENYKLQQVEEGK